ncbi:sugar kinase [Caenimonas sp. SL110]|uniref:sugar kinase n=1 Tax=Caenimonas sp. SL110 TaxID=1450524 RepID=UPI00065479CF|nr:sugar kinase [Caenimonas sp. SL110]
MDKPFDIAAIGEAMLEFNQTQAGQPHYLQGFGGDTSNAVIAAARAGARTTYLTRLGQDSFGDALMALWLREGVDTQGVERDAGAPTGIYFVTHGPAGHEFSYLRAGSAASRMTPQWLPRTLVRRAKILHVSGISLAISATARETVLQAMQEARDAGTLVSLDSNLRLKLWPLDEARKVLARAIGLSDIFLPSIDDVCALSGLEDPEAIIDWSHAHGARQVALKLGGDGALVSDGTTRLSIPGHRVKVVDATGAGDCFCGNLLARLAKGDTIFEAARYANAAAALSVQGFGAVAPLPHPAHVQALLA